MPCFEGVEPLLLKIGFYLPNLGPLATRENVQLLAKEAEGLGYDSLWVVERLLFPLKPRTPYGGTPDGSLPLVYTRSLDPLDALIYAAGHTERVLLGTSVLVIPFYNPVVLARRFTTLDVLSNGRALCGLGLGWSADEYEAVGVPMRQRGARQEEFLRLLKAIWTDGVVEFHGQFYQVPASRFDLKPVQEPHPPIYLGTYRPGVFQRIARYANGWNLGGAPNIDYVTDHVKALKEQFRKAGRDPATAEVVLRSFPTVLEGTSPKARPLLVGTLDEIRQDLDGLRHAGVTHVFFDLQFGRDGEQLASIRQRMEQLREAAP